MFMSDEEWQGEIVKGVGPDCDSLTFQSAMLRRRFIRFEEDRASNEIILSSKIANKLMLDVGEKVVMYFVQDPPRYRNFDIVGIYETFLEDFDDKIVLGDIQTIRN